MGNCVQLVLHPFGLNKCSLFIVHCYGASLGSKGRKTNGDPEPSGDDADAKRSGGEGREGVSIASCRKTSHLLLRRAGLKHGFVITFYTAKDEGGCISIAASLM